MENPGNDPESTGGRRPGHSNRALLVARLLWVFPGLLLLLTVNQILVVGDLRDTLRDGHVVAVEVLAIETVDRADVTMASVRLRVPMPNGSTTERVLPLPITFVRALEGSDSLRVFVAEGAERDVVIEDIGRAQWRLAAINAGISLTGCMLLAWGLFAWNRYLVRRGDPAAA